MICICGHSDDLHIVIYDENSGEIIVEPCSGCDCHSFCEDINRDELEVE